MRETMLSEMTDAGVLRVETGKHERSVMKTNMNTKSLLAMGLCAAVLFTAFDASARAWRRRYVRRPAPHQRAPQPPPKPVAPKILTVSGTLYSLNAPGKSLMIQDDNTRSTLNLVITPATTFTRVGQPVLASSIKTYEHVTVTYQDTDKMLKSVNVTPKPGTTTSPPAKSRKQTSPKNRK